MMHPATEIRFVNVTVGHGVFATEPIPAGTIVYVEDRLEIRLAEDDPLCQDPAYKSVIDRYAHEGAAGERIICWDYAKYVNHCCHANSLSTGWGFEIAIRDIAAGEEITDEYALFYRFEIPLACHHLDCRRVLQPAQDVATYGRSWDSLVQAALQHTAGVPQPLLPYLDAETAVELRQYLETGRGYRPLTPPDSRPAA
ncbi:MAG: SET domain-containing protein [Anaerolineales bacterium]|nr:SET domain-containing protein [Anaerolineales bacterium]